MCVYAYVVKKHRQQTTKGRINGRNNKNAGEQQQQQRERKKKKKSLNG
jgi:hypothetical protein